MKNLTLYISFFLALFTFSCTSNYEKEMTKSAKKQTASDRINSSQENNESLFKELD